MLLRKLLPETSQFIDFIFKFYGSQTNNIGRNRLCASNGCLLYQFAFIYMSIRNMI